jgi:D-isomer specific 2-hydroxyacid dehydrogenase, NAD binding domain
LPTIKVAYVVLGDTLDICMVTEYRELEDLRPSSDVVSIHATLSEETRGLIDAKRFGLMKKTSFLINTATKSDFVFAQPRPKGDICSSKCTERLAALFASLSLSGFA